MIHPATELRYISPQIGLGVFATAFIAKGTITYVHDDWEIEIEANNPKLKSPLYAPIIERYGHTNPDGSRTISWDIGRYVNHCCQPNTMSTGYDFEIAIQDIAAGEQITDEYGLFEFVQEMALICDKAGCRGRLRPTDIDTYAAQWDEQVKDALGHLPAVDQPLWVCLDTAVQTAVEQYLQTGTNYQSVLTRKPT